MAFGGHYKIPGFNILSNKYFLTCICFSVFDRVPASVNVKPLKIKTLPICEYRLFMIDSSFLYHIIC